MFDLEGKWPSKVEQTGSTLGLSEIQTKSQRILDMLLPILDETMIFPMLENIVYFFLQILGDIDQELVTCFSWKTIKISILNMLLPMLDETRIGTIY